MHVKKSAEKLCRIHKQKNVTKFYNSFKSASLSNKKVTHTYFATRTGIKTKKRLENTNENDDFYAVGTLHK